MSTREITSNPLSVLEAHDNTPRILVVDDDLDVGRMIKMNLEAEGYNVFCAFDGESALHHLDELRFNMVILDVNMPGTDGLQVLRRMRCSPETSSIPVIFATGENASEISSLVGLDHTTGYIGKPIELEGLNSMVRLFLERFPITVH